MPVPTFDVFSGRVDKNVFWIEAVEGSGNAYERMTKLAAQSPGPYFVFCTRTPTVCGSIDTSVPEEIRPRASA